MAVIYKNKIKKWELPFIIFVFLGFMLMAIIMSEIGLLVNITVVFPFVILSKLFYSKWVNPVIVYSSIWLLMMFLYELRLVPGPDIKIITYIAILFANVSFCLGAFTISLFGNKSKYENNNVQQVNYDLWNIIIFVSSILGALAFCIQYLMIGTLNYVEIHYQLRQGNMTTGWLEWAKRFSPAAIIMWIIFKKKKTNYSLIEKLNVFLVTFNLILLLIYPNRSMLVFVIFAYAIYLLVYSSDNLFSNKKRMISILLLLVMFFLFFVFTQLTLGKEKGSSWVAPYRYIALNLPNFQYSMEEFYIKTNGTSTFYLPVLVLSKIGLLDRPEVSPLDGVSNKDLDWFNTYPYLRDVYNDFGWFGFLIIPYFYGIITGFIYLKSLNNKNSLHLKYCNIVLLYSLILSIRQIPFASITWTFILFAPLILNFIFHFKYANKFKVNKNAYRDVLTYET